MAQGRYAGTSFKAQLKRVQEQLDQILPVFMRKMAEEVVTSSPVLSGNYVKAHEIGTNERSFGGRFGSRFTKGSPSSNPSADKEAALASLMAQIASMPLDTPSVTLKNSVAHAYKVEYAGWGSTPPYMVYQRARAKSQQFLEEAKAEVGLK